MHVREERNYHILFLLKNTGCEKALGYTFLNFDMFAIPLLSDSSVILSLLKSSFNLQSVSIPAILRTLFLLKLMHSTDLFQL